MATMSRIKLSGSTDYKGIKVTTVAPIDGSDTTIHTAVSGTTDTDLVTLWAVNLDTVARELALGWGGTTAIDNILSVQIAPKSGLVLVAYKLGLQNGLAIVASAGAANVVVVYGYVDRIDA